MRLLLGLLIPVIGLAIMPAWIPESTALSEDVPVQNTPQKLIEAWVSFHAMDLCQGVDTVFVFNKNGMEVWCLVGDGRSYQKFQELVEPLRSSFSIELYATHPTAQKKSGEDKDPPASLWENYELRNYLRDPLAHAKERLGIDMPTIEEEVDSQGFPGVDVLKQRLIAYAEQTLEWNQRMGQYAKDLPELARLALNPAAAPRLRLQANAACLEHSQNLGKYLSRLKANLIQALPKPNKKGSLPSRSEKPVNAGKTPLDNSVQISYSGQNLARRIYHFIHPEHHTVALDELRQPSLLQALETLERMNLDFQKALAKSVGKQAVGSGGGAANE